MGIETVAALSLAFTFVLPVVFSIVAGVTYLAQHMWVWVDDGDSDVGNNKFLTLVGRLHGYRRDIYSSDYKNEDGSHHMDNDNMIFFWLIRLAIAGFLLPIVFSYPIAGLTFSTVAAIPFLLRTLVRFNKKIKKLEGQNEMDQE